MKVSSMVKSKKSKKRKDVERIRVPNFTKYYATNCHCGLTNQDVRIEFMNEKIKENGDWIMLIDCLVILSPIGAKKLSQKLNEVVSTYEEKHGEISCDVEDIGY